MGEVIVRRVGRDDLPAVQRLLEPWIDESTWGPARSEIISNRLQTIAEAADGHPSRWFIVAVDAHHRVVGVAGLQADGIAPELVDPTEPSVEILSTYVAVDAAGRGIGRAMVDELEAVAGAAGFSAVVVVSGSHCRDTGYPFWQRRYGEPARRDADYWAPGEERVVWRHRL